MTSREYDQLLRTYKRHGQAASIRQGLRMGLPFGYCEPCEWESPIVTLDGGGRVCGVCGTSYEEF